MQSDNLQNVNGVVSYIMLFYSLILFVFNITLPSNGQYLSTVSPLEKDTHFSLAVQGTGGDVDCYLIDHGRVIVRDEAGRNSCHLSAFALKGDAFQIWMVNHSDQLGSYTIAITRN